MDRGNIGLECKLAFSVKGVPHLRLLTLPPEKYRFWPFFRIDAGAGKLLGTEG